MKCRFRSISRCGVASPGGRSSPQVRWLLARPDSIISLGGRDDRPDYDYADGVTLQIYELAEGLHAEILCGADKTGELVENMLVGAMSAEAALTYFRRRTNKAVITGGDRVDIQLAALETSTRCLILTGNLYPSPVVLNRADELGVPMLLADMDTLAAIEVVESYMGRSRVQQTEKVERFTALLKDNFNFKLLYKELGIHLK